MTTLIARARALALELPRYRATHDATRQLDPQVVARLRELELLASLVPHELGGHELSPSSYVAMLEALASGDAATAWCVMTASTSALMAPYLPREVARTIWAPKQAPFLAGIFAPSGQLVEGRLTGRWSWASGSRHADWFVVGALAERRHVICVVPPTAVGVVDNWDTLGLAGTGSHDLVIEDAVVPPSHVTSVFDRAPWTSGALYRVPLFGLLAAGIAGCALGIAGRALAHVGATLTAEAPSGALHRYAELRARLDAGRAALVTATDGVAARADAGPVAAADRGALRLAASWAVTSSVDVIRGAYHLGGGGAVRVGSPLQDALRDVETLSTHRLVVDKVLPAAARALLGLGTPPPDL